MVVVLRFAALYATIVFLLGFLLGTLRVLFLGPLTGELAAVLIEMPIMLAFSWVAASRIFCGKGLSPEQGVEIGLASFLFLQVAESLLAGFFGPYAYLDNVLTYWSDMSTPRLAGLLGQIAFAALPFIQILRSRDHVR